MAANSFVLRFIKGSVHLVESVPFQFCIVLLVEIEVCSYLSHGVTQLQSRRLAFRKGLRRLAATM